MDPEGRAYVTYARDEFNKVVDLLQLLPDGKTEFMSLVCIDRERVDGARDRFLESLPGKGTESPEAEPGPSGAAPGETGPVPGQALPRLAGTYFDNPSDAASVPALRKGPAEMLSTSPRSAGGVVLWLIFVLMEGPACWFGGCLGFCRGLFRSWWVPNGVIAIGGHGCCEA